MIKSTFTRIFGGGVLLASKFVKQYHEITKRRGERLKTILPFVISNFLVSEVDCSKSITGDGV